MRVEGQGSTHLHRQGACRSLLASSQAFLLRASQLCPSLPARLPSTQVGFSSSAASPISSTCASTRAGCVQASRAHAHTHTHMHVCTHARTHARTHTHTHTHTQKVSKEWRAGLAPGRKVLQVSCFVGAQQRLWLGCCGRFRQRWVVAILGRV
jgi:ABC-type nickel/cobalt efflux system permease component RcnA